MTQPVDGPAELTAALAAFAGVTIPTPPDEGSPEFQDLDVTVAAVNSVVRGLPIAQLSDPDTVEDWPARVLLGSTMLVKRFWRRRDTPGGVALISDDGAVLAFARSDPDVALMLELGAYEKPNRVG
jgi:hypothetical protein